MKSLAILGTCTTSIYNVTESCCMGIPGSVFNMPNNECFQTDLIRFEACVNASNTELRNSHANYTTSKTIPSSRNGTLINITKYETHPLENATLKCTPQRGSAARTLPKDVTIASIAFLVVSVAAYTALWWVPRKTTTG